MNLSNLLEALTVLKITGRVGNGPEVDSIHYRSQDVKPNGLFVAIEGLAVDGHDFIDEALDRGACAIVTQKPVNKASIVIQVENTRKALAAMADRFYASPSQQLSVIGITGTNGKTTTALLIERILELAGAEVGVIGTLNYRYCQQIFQNPMTTPESLDLQKILADMLTGGVTHVVMEVSSHAIDLHRIDHCEFNIGVFTNLTQDHLDYHKNMDAYWRCKRSFFTDVLCSGPKASRASAVINHNDAKGRELLDLLDEAGIIPVVLSTGNSDTDNIRPLNIEHDPTGMGGVVSTPDGTFDFKSPLVGQHNLENILCAAGVAFLLNLPLKTIKAGLEAVATVPGRLERIPNDLQRFIYVDYAHTPDALKNVLCALRNLSAGRIICVFGCGGDRDRTKRPQMGEISASLCDLSMITSDNPRTEVPMNIIDQILEGTIKAGASEYRPLDATGNFSKRAYMVEPDRKTAIQTAILVSRPGDTVLIAGKGNETYQIIGPKTIPFDDREVARAALLKLKPGDSSQPTPLSAGLEKNRTPESKHI